MPNYWTMNAHYDPQWDKELRSLMKEHDFVQYKANPPGTWGGIPHISEVEAKIGDKVVWIANHPYASFTTSANYRLDARPSRQTIYLAGKKLKEDKKKITWPACKRERRKRALQELGI